MGKNFFHETVWISLLVFIPICWSWTVQIIKPRTSTRSNGFVKENAETELALFTASIGFVDDEHLQYSTPTHNFFRNYLKLTKWHEAADARITKNYFVGHGVKVCTAYLSDPIFGEHGISLFVSSSTYKFSTELKFVKFLYSSRKMALVKVVKCPIQRYNKDTFDLEESKLYFQEIRHNDPLRVELKRGYFVFANIKGKWAHDEPLQFLMYTSCNKTSLPALKEAGEEAEFQRSKELDREGVTIKFKLKKPLPTSENNVRLFGDEAETVFLTKMYGFVDHARPLWQKKKFIQIMDRLKEGYEVNAAKLQEVRKSNPVTVCKNYINHNDELKKRKIRIENDITMAQIAWGSKLVQFPHSKIILEGRKLEILQCPVTFAGVYLYLWPVHYMKTGKAAQVFTFKEVGKNTGIVTPFILSPVHERDFEKSTDVSLTNRAKKEKNTGKISSLDKVEPSSHHPLSNLIDLENTETNMDTANVEYSSPHLLQDLIDFTDPSPNWGDFGGSIPEEWIKFKDLEEGGMVEDSLESEGRQN